MKLLVAFNLLNIEEALSIAKQIEPHVSMFSIGPLLLYKYGVTAIERFRETFPDAPLFVEAKVLERPQESITLLTKAGANWISVMAGAGSQTIHTASITARTLGSKIIVDLADASSVGQAALEAGRLGAEALTFHKPSSDDTRVSFSDRWHMIKGNTNLPIYISAHISRENVGEVLGLEPSGIILGSAIVKAHDPVTEITSFADFVSR